MLSPCYCSLADCEAPPVDEYGREIAVVTHWICLHLNRFHAREAAAIVTHRLRPGTIDAIFEDLMVSAKGVAAPAPNGDQLSQLSAAFLGEFHSPLAKSETGISDLPPELLFSIFTFVESRDLVKNISGVCREWREIAVLPNMWLHRPVPLGRDNLPINVCASAFQGWPAPRIHNAVFSPRVSGSLDDLVALVDQWGHLPAVGSNLVACCLALTKQGILTPVNRPKLLSSLYAGAARLADDLEARARLVRAVAELTKFSPKLSAQSCLKLELELIDVAHWERAPAAAYAAVTQILSQALQWDDESQPTVERLFDRCMAALIKRAREASDNDMGIYYAAEGLIATLAERRDRKSQSVAILFAQLLWLKFPTFSREFNLLPSVCARIARSDGGVSLLVELDVLRHVIDVEMGHNMTVTRLARFRDIATDERGRRALVDAGFIQVLRACVDTREKGLVARDIALRVLEDAALDEEYPALRPELRAWMQCHGNLRPLMHR